MIHEPFPLSDAGNAARFAAINESYRYVHGPNHWLVWDGTRWAVDRLGSVYGSAIGTARSILHDAIAAGGKTDATAIAKHALQSERKDRLDAMLALARVYPSIALAPDLLDADPDLFNVQNGTLNLRTGAFFGHSKMARITKLAPVEYHQDATAPTWAAFLERVVPDAEVRAYLQRAVGYTLTGNVDEHCLFFAYGTGANGKTTFLETVRDVLGEYSVASGPDLLLSDKQVRHPVERAVLQGARFVTTVEIGEGRSWDESKVKWLTGGDLIDARWMGGNPFTFSPTHKLWIAGNHRPRAMGTDHGFWRRVHFIPFTVTIPEEHRDPRLREKLRAELPGILLWAVQGCQAWVSGGLKPPKAVVDATRDYRESEDTLAAFLEECCVLDPEARVLINVLFSVYQRWEERSGERKRRTKRALGDALEERGFERKRGTGGVAGIIGLTLRETSSERRPASDASDASGGHFSKPLYTRV